MNGTTDDRYLEWLYGLVAAVRNRNPARSYWTLLRHLYTREFVWVIPNDDNRVEDGRELRDEFVSTQETDEIDPEWMSLGCSMLEMLIALSRRASFETDKAPGDWFWFFVQNMGLIDYTDNNCTPAIEVTIDNAIDQVIYRTYKSDGHGGLFPLKYPEDDQRRVELWYQLSAYLLEDMSL